jgi:hypothetical protein
MISLASAYRHAAYFAPAPDSAAWQLGAQWLGRCPHSGQNLAQPVPEFWEPAAFAQITREPRRYGWHATLKAPFALANHTSAADLRACFLAVATAVSVPIVLHLEVALVANFLALVPRQRCEPLHAVADACVRQLHPCAAPLPSSEMARRRRGGLTARQEDMLAQWAYPYVFDDFAFHMTLTGVLDALSNAQKQQLKAHANAWFEPLLTQGLTFDGVSWFAEDLPGADFRWVERFGFAL